MAEDSGSGARLRIRQEKRGETFDDVVEKGARDFRRLQGSPSTKPGYSQRRKRTEHGFYCPVA
jgi:hypothetical protein